LGQAGDTELTGATGRGLGPGMASALAGATGMGAGRAGDPAMASGPGMASATNLEAEETKVEFHEDR
jgi:hypothetical protein